MTDAEIESNPLLAALAEAEYDDEPYTDGQKAKVQSGREAFSLGDVATLDEVWQKLVEEDDSSSVAPF